MKLTVLTIATLSLVLTTGCKTSEKHNLHHFDTAFFDEHNSKNSLDWNGTYEGVIPCADCSGIDTKISIDTNLNYTKQIKYLGKSDDYITTKGRFSWDEIGSNVIIEDISYMVGENTLIQLNKQKENIDGKLASQYVLQKIAIDTLFTNIKWELFELAGQLIEKENKNIPYFILDCSDKAIIGSSGCNNFHGKFELKPGNRVSFSKIAATQKLCFNAPYEGPLLNALERADNYIVKNDTLSIHKARMTTLAKFVAIK